MREVLGAVRRFFRGADMLLLTLGMASSVFGMVLIASASHSYPSGYWPNLRTQIIAFIIGIVLFVLFSCIDPDVLERFWKWLIGFNVLMVGILFLFGNEVYGNKSWINIPGIGFSLQPAEIIKISFIIVMSVQMYRFRENVSGIVPVLGYMLHFAGLFGMLLWVTNDIGVSLIYLAIFLCLLLGAGVRARWFLLGVVLLTLSIPLIWSILPSNHQNRIIMTFNPMMDPEGLGYQPLLSMKMISGGQLYGQGLFNGYYTQMNKMPMRHNDFIFSVCGEELGFIGCAVLVCLLVVMIFRCLYVATRAKSGVGSLICIGVAGMLIFQTFLNVFMCVGLAPVVGITLPFFSAGGTSLMASFAAIGLVSGVRNHPKTTWLDH